MDEKDISLFPHNEEAYKALCQSTENYPLAFIEHATGTGKSFILLKFLYTKMRKKRTLFISMHDEMFSQLFNDQMKTLGISKDEFVKFDTLIYPNLLKYDMKYIIENYDCIVFDEAHHCGAEKWGQKVQELKELVLKTPGKLMIGATATGIRYLDNYMDVSEKYFDGKTVSRLPVSTAILKNLLPAPLYVNTLNSCTDITERIFRKLKKVLRTPETIKLLDNVKEIDNQINEESTVEGILKKYNVHPGEKYIVFCKDISDLKKKRIEAEEWFKKIGPIKTFAAHSGQKKDHNMEEIDEFSKQQNEISLMFAVDIFNEGFHIDGVDGVFMFRKTKSPIVYFQQIGRALSFSVRKKQIKIFDFVNNIAESDVIYELYKEIIAEAKILIEKYPEKKELYEEILSRFQIIDHTTNILDKLSEIEKNIDENYIVKTNIDSAIIKLQEYRTFYPNTDFKSELTSKRLSFEYTRAYEFICRVNEQLTLEQIDLLKELNIDFGYMINMPKEKRIKYLQGHKTISELKESLFNEFINEYIEFYNQNKHRPKNNGNEYEISLNKKYRSYLTSFNVKEINKMLNLFPFKSTVEEIILTNNYPEKSEIDKYTSYIKEKLELGEPLDEIELKVIKKIRQAISIRDVELLEFLEQTDDLNLKIESAILKLKYYKENIDPNERFDNIPSLSGLKDIFQAITIIHKQAKRITTPQFEKLLLLNIKLPKEIDMTLEKRLEVLDGYNSFYEKEEQANKSVINQYIKFIKENKRRPSFNNTEEQEIATKYNEDLLKSTIPKIKELSRVLKENNIELTNYEKVLIGEPIKLEIIDQYIQGIEDKIHNGIRISPIELKILRAIKRHSYKTTINYLDELLKNINGINEILEDLDSLEKELKKTDYPKTKELSLNATKCIRKISENQRFITIYIIKRIKELGINISEDLESIISSLDNSINLYEQNLKEILSFINSYINYIKENKKRPEVSSELNSKYRFYLPNLTKGTLNRFLSQIIGEGLELTFEEKVLLKHQYTDKEANDYIEYIKRKFDNNESSDKLEIKVLNGINKIEYSEKERLKKKLNSTKIEDPKKIEEEIERKIVDNLRECIFKNPEQEIDFNNGIHKISSQNRRDLEKYRYDLLSLILLKRIIEYLKTSKKSIDKCEDEKLKKAYYEYLSNSKLSFEAKLLLDEARSLNLDNIYIEKGIEKERFFTEYINFIINNNGNRPNINNDNNEETKLATEFNKIKDTLTTQELKKIEEVIRKSITAKIEETFYEKYYSFIINNGRFPCGNSDNPEEVQLNNLFLELNDKLTKEQLLEIRKLKKVYSRATLLANQEFAKKALLKR